MYSFLWEVRRLMKKLNNRNEDFNWITYYDLEKQKRWKLCSEEIDKGNNGHINEKNINCGRTLLKCWLHRSRNDHSLQGTPLTRVATNGSDADGEERAVRPWWCSDLPSESTDLLVGLRTVLWNRNVKKSFLVLRI